MDGGADGGTSTRDRRRGFKKLLAGWNTIRCCGASWGLAPTTIPVLSDDDEEEETSQPPGNDISEYIFPTPHTAGMVAECSADQSPVQPGMVNLGAALAAEREVWEAERREGMNLTASTPSTPSRVSLMRLLAEEQGGGETAELVVVEQGSGVVCCVCMVRNKGAAFIPCGHTYCRVCSRELWVNRGTCPLCNRSIAEILDIF